MTALTLTHGPSPGFAGATESGIPRWGAIGGNEDVPVEERRNAPPDLK